MLRSQKSFQGGVIIGNIDIYSVLRRLKYNAPGSLYRFIFIITLEIRPFPNKTFELKKRDKKYDSAPFLFL